jgi:hypothetical protein
MGVEIEASDVKALTPGRQPPTLARFTEEET